MIPYDDSGNIERFISPFLDRLCDHFAGIQLIICLDFLFRQLSGAGNIPVEIIRMRGTQRRNRHPGLRIRDCMRAVRVRNTADRGEPAIQFQMCRCIGGWLIAAFDDLSCHEIHDDHIFRLHSVVLHPARLNNDIACLPVDLRHIAPCVNDNTLCHKIQIGLADSFFHFFKHDILSILHNGRAPPLSVPAFPKKGTRPSILSTVVYLGACETLCEMELKHRFSQLPGCILNHCFAAAHACQAFAGTICLCYPSIVSAAFFSASTHFKYCFLYFSNPSCPDAFGRIVSACASRNTFSSSQSLSASPSSFSRM